MAAGQRVLLVGVCAGLDPDQADVRAYYDGFGSAGASRNAGARLVFMLSAK